jgi:hypothetical protein
MATRGAPGTLSPCSSASLRHAAWPSNSAPKRNPTSTAKSSWHKPQHVKPTRQKEKSKPARFPNRSIRHLATEAVVDVVDLLGGKHRILKGMYQKYSKFA